MRFLSGVALFLLKLVLIRCSFRPSYCSSNQNSERSLFLWSIEKPGLVEQSYLFGTIHVPYTEVWDYVSPTVKSLFRKVDSVVFELDLYNPNTIATLNKCKQLPVNEHLSDHLPSHLYRRLEHYMTVVKRTMSDWIDDSTSSKFVRLHADRLFRSIAGDWQNRRPIWILLMLNSLTESNVRKSEMPVFDVFLAQEAQANSKRLDSVESVAEQCDPLNSLDTDQVLFALNYTLSYHERDRPAESPTVDLIRHYNCGSLEESVFERDSRQLFDGMDKQSSERATKVDAYFRRELIHKRNIRMAERVAVFLSSQPKTGFFFALGAGHFLGKDSIIKLLEMAGYRIRPVDENPGRHSSSIKQLATSDENLHQFYPKSGAEIVKKSRFRELWVRLPDFENRQWDEKTQISISIYSQDSSSTILMSLHLVFLCIVIVFTLEY